MAKQYYTLKSFARGINNLRDPRDISEDEANFIQNMSIDSLGKIKSAGSFYGHGVGNDGTGLVNDGKYVADRGGTTSASLLGSGGYNLYYFEADHSTSFDQTLSVNTPDSSGPTDGEITFVQPSTLASSGFSNPASQNLDDTEHTH